MSLRKLDVVVVGAGKGVLVALFLCFCLQGTFINTRWGLLLLLELLL